MNIMNWRSAATIITFVGSGLSTQCHSDTDKNPSTMETGQDNTALSTPATTVLRTTRVSHAADLLFNPMEWADYYDTANENCINERKVGGFPVELISVGPELADLRYRCISSGGQATSIRRDPITYTHERWAQSNQDGRRRCLQQNYDGGFLANVREPYMTLVCVNASRLLTRRQTIIAPGWQEDLSNNYWQTAALVAENTCRQHGHAGGGFFDGTSEGTGENLVYGVLCLDAEE
ncbi:hypothetical protein AB3662_26630 [Sorangium cellulosum]|uniref:hypothetical protein n=1 Tax=Sorangium cellulosum TaxID=56 RepID=UPI003D9A1B3D